jgi:iron(III) transport system substrate-binding protein
MANSIFNSLAKRGFMRATTQRLSTLLLCNLFLSLGGIVGCVARSEREVVVYCALDQEFSKPILDSFQRRSEGKVEVAAKYDVESTKTIGLVNRIIEEQQRPSGDLFWNNEILHTVRLQKAGLLERIDWPIPSDWPSGMKARDGTWCGFAARARVLLINTDLIPNDSQRPQSVAELADPKWQGKCGWARPAFGTSATHLAVLASLLGDQKAKELFDRFRINATTLSGNKQVALAVSSGQLAWGLTDTDDALIEQERGMPVAIVFPDQAPGMPGTLRIPNTIAVIKGGPHPIAARALASFLLSPAVEDRLAMGESGQLPLHRDVTTAPRVLPKDPVRWMEVDFEAAAEKWDVVKQWVRE